MTGLTSDLRYALRRIRGGPLVALAVVGSLALGIGANTTVFTFANALLFQPLPVASPERLVALFTRAPQYPGHLPVAFPDHEDLVRSPGLREQLSSSAIYRLVSIDLAGEDGPPERIFAEVVSGRYFATLGVEAALGRTFSSADDRSPDPVVVVSHGFWQRRLGGDRAAVGRTVRLNGRPFTVLGVAPPGFHGVEVLHAPELWAPLSMVDTLLVGSLRQYFESRDGLFFQAVARLAPGATHASASAALAAFAERLGEQHPQTNGSRTLEPVPLEQASLPPDERDAYLLGGTLLLSAAGLLFLIACSNVASLLLARSLARRREMAVRLAIGAGRGRLVRQLLIEALVLSLAGGAAGLALAVAARELLWSLRPPQLPEALDPGLDPTVLGFTFVLALVAGLLFGLAPALQSMRVDLVSALKDEMSADGPRHRLGLRKGLVVAQVALCVVSLSGAALFTTSLRNARQIDPGFAVDDLLLMTVNVGNQGYEEAAGRALFDRLEATAEATGGVRAVALSQKVPLLPLGGGQGAVAPDGVDLVDPATGVIAGIDSVSSDYFTVLEIPVLRGRAFTDADREDARPVVIVNQTLADRLWPGEDPLGRQLHYKGEGVAAAVVGVVPTVKYRGLGEEPQPYTYRPAAQRYSPWMTLLVRAEGDPRALLPTVRARVQQAAPAMPLFNVQTVAEAIDGALWAPRVAAWLLALFGALALTLAALGVYGVIAYSVGRRGRELGIRMAIGAQRGDVLRLVLWQGLGLCATGVALGALGALALSPLLLPFLFGVETIYPVVLAATALLSVVALVAVYLPARRGTTVAPVAALRGE